MVAWLATMKSRSSDVKHALLDSVSARCGALRELGPLSFARLLAAFIFVAILGPNLVVFPFAFFATMPGGL